MNRFNRREYGLSERVTLDVCYHFLTFVKRWRASPSSSANTHNLRESMRRALSHMVYNGKLDNAHLSHDQANSDTDETSGDVRLELELYNSSLFPVKNGIKLTFSRNQVIEMLDQEANTTASSDSELLLELWNKALPVFTKDEITKAFRNLMIVETKPHWGSIRNTQEGRDLLLRIFDAVITQLHSNLMVDNDETVISCHELNTGASSDQDITVRVVTENLQGTRFQLDLNIKPKMD